MILHCSFEELTALDDAVERVMDAIDTGGVAAPPEVQPDLERLGPLLTGDISIETFDEQQSIERAVEFLLADARERTDSFILDEYASAESAIRSYFEYAHLLTVLDRVRQIGHEMRSIIEVMTGKPPDEAAGRIPFDD